MQWLTLPENMDSDVKKEMDKVLYLFDHLQDVVGNLTQFLLGNGEFATIKTSQSETQLLTYKTLYLSVAR